MAKAKLHAADGAFKNADYELPSSHFEQEISEAAMYQAVDTYLNNNRQGTSKTKNRSEVSGGGRKPWKQKGTGRARQGSNTAPQWARGGKAHGPTPRKYKKDLNKKVRRRALLSAFTVKAKEEAVFVFETIALAAAKTKELIKVLKTAALEGQKSLILTDVADNKLVLASRNIPGVQVQRVWDVNTYELINSKNVIFTDAAIKALGKPNDYSAPKDEVVAKGRRGFYGSGKVGLGEK